MAKVSKAMAKGEKGESKKEKAKEMKAATPSKTKMFKKIVGKKTK